jgi:hypothetical protein
MQEQFPGHESPSRLNICLHCADEKVYPLSKEGAGPGLWRLILRCPECESRREAVFPQPQVDELQAAMEAGREAIEKDLEYMKQVNRPEW